MPRKAPKQTVEAQPGDQQGVEAASRRRKSVQSDDQSKTARDRRFGTELRQFQFATIEGATSRIEFVRGTVPER